jgi:phosphatidylserine/phosphatidylglycerophosphate/cardiolipin synthase-like enzyme
MKREAVQIHVILPGASDKPILDTVATTEFHEMLHLGVKIYRWDPPEGWSATKMLHTKAWLVDYHPGRSGLAYVGSSNATQRSHILDEEAGIVSTSPAFAHEVYSRLFEPDIHRDSRVETPENFHVTRSTNAAIRSGRWMRRFLLSLFFV